MHLAARQPRTAMLMLLGKSTRHCDGVSRRQFLTAGALGFGGLTLADLLRAEDAAGVKSSNKAVLNSARPCFLGPTYNAFRPDISKMFARELEPAMKKELAAHGENHTLQLTLADGLTPERLNDRTQLLAGFDTARRDLDASGNMD